MPTTNDTPETTPDPMGPALLVRCSIGGVLMGLANLVPGISGGTMLLATGVYTRFIDAISDVTRLRLKADRLIVLATVIGAALAAIVLLSGVAKSLVVEHPWVMRSIFIGLTLGGVPLLWTKLRSTPARTGGVGASGWIGIAAGLAAMVALALVQASGAGAAGGSRDGWTMVMLAGVAGASAMILPGVSGAYLLLVLGQYVPILAAIDRAKDGAAAGEWGQVTGEFGTFIPLGIGVVLGVVVVANVLRVLLHRFEHPTIGVLLGLLVGAVAGLYPFQSHVRPEVGDVIKGVVMTPETIEALDKGDWALVTFSPSAVQIGASLGLIVVGIAMTMLIGRLGAKRKSAIASDGAQPGA